MSDVQPRDPGRGRWKAVLAPRWIAWHVLAIVVTAGMLWLGDWQFHRAEGGNALSWGYTFEWPIFAGFAVFFWIKTIRDELRPAARGKDKQAGSEDGAQDVFAAPAASQRQVAAGQTASGQDLPADVELDEYNAYLARLHERTRGHGRRRGLRSDGA